jgi:hypothetical protein
LKKLSIFQTIYFLIPWKMSVPLDKNEKLGLAAFVRHRRRKIAAVLGQFLDSTNMANPGALSPSPMLLKLDHREGGRNDMSLRVINVFGFRKSPSRRTIERVCSTGA